MFLKDRVNTTLIHNKQASGNSAQKSEMVKKLCFSFNRGNCRFGAKCRFDHHCGLWGKFEHGAFNCRRGLAADEKGKGATSGDKILEKKND